MSFKDTLSVIEIEKHLNDKISSDKILILEEIDSTNNEAKRRILRNDFDKTIIISNSQTAGRGRMGRSFFSPADSGLYCSIVLKPEDIGCNHVLITTLMCVAVCKAIERVSGVTPGIKWVNDLYLNEKKVCGILAEAVNDLKTGNIKAVVVGIGINCTTVFDGELADIAGSVFNGCVSVRNQLLAEILNEIQNILNVTDFEKLLDYYRKHSIILGKKVRVLGEEDKIYVAEKIGMRGELFLKDESGGSRVLTSGEVSIRFC